MKRIVASLFVVCLCASAFSLSSRKEQKILKIIEEGSEKELKAAFKDYNYLENTLVGDDKDTLLMHAIKNGRDVSFVKLLLRGGVKLKKKNKKGEDALFYVARYSEENPKVLNHVASKWGSRRSFQRGLLRQNKEGVSAYEVALENLGEKNLSRIEKNLDPKKYVPVKREYLDKKGLLTEELKAELDALEKKEPEKSSSKVSIIPEDVDSKTESGKDKSSGEKTSDGKEKDGKAASKDGEASSTEGKTSEGGSSSENGNGTSGSGSGASGSEGASSSATGSSSGDGSSSSAVDVNSVLSGGSSGNGAGASGNEKHTEVYQTSVDIEKKQKELEKLYGKNGSSENSKTLLFDYEPEFEDEVPEDISSKKIELATIKNPNTRDFNGRTALMRAVKEGNDWEIRSLIASGADVNLKDNEGWSALMFAVRYQNNVDIVKLLLDNGADIYSVNRYGSTPLLLAACYTANPEILKTVLNAYSGAQNDIFKAFILSITSNSGNYASQLAKLQVFIDGGISMNRFYEGKTPLMYACEYAGTTKVIKLLIDYGAVYTIRDASGKKAFDYAKQNNKLERDEIYWLLNGN